MTSPLRNPDGPPEQIVALRGLEVDNLLSFLALLGLLRALEADKPEWSPRVSWAGPPWEARLHLRADPSQADIAEAAAHGVESLASRYQFEGRKNVDFEPDEFRAFALRSRADPISAVLATALTSEYPRQRSGGLHAGPLVLMFGAGHQNFLERLRSVPLNEGPRHAGPEMARPEKIAEALFSPWKRADRTDAFRWDPLEDQRYALRFGNPSKAGAATTAHGANRLAAIGFLSFMCAPGRRSSASSGTVRYENEIAFVWPVWSEPLALHGIERLLSHPDVLNGRLDRIQPHGVVEIYRARRTENGRFKSVSRAVPLSSY